MFTIFTHNLKHKAMANKKKHRLKKKKVCSYSIITQAVEDFNEICDLNELVPSNEVEKMILNFNKEHL